MFFLVFRSPLPQWEMAECWKTKIILYSDICSGLHTSFWSSTSLEVYACNFQNSSVLQRVWPFRLSIIMECRVLLRGFNERSAVQIADNRTLQHSQSPHHLVVSNTTNVDLDLMLGGRSPSSWQLPLTYSWCWWNATHMLQWTLTTEYWVLKHENIFCVGFNEPHLQSPPHVNCSSSVLVMNWVLLIVQGLANSLHQTIHRQGEIWS